AEEWAEEEAQIEAEVLQAITERLNAYEGFVASRDLEGWWSYWTEDVHVMEPGMDMAGEDFYNMGKDFFEAGGEVFSANWITDELFVHGDVAYLIGEIHEAFRYPGAEPAEAHNHIFVRWEKQPDGVWKMSRFVAGPIDAPPAG
ncbi:MAG: hypothetical protein HKO65_05320, partial [Gemmatimonadetes bacterium]|nr:hypothetical protein [Gemmatimonadota bacterium]